MNTYIPSTKIVTFGCRNCVYVYPPNCDLIPRKPYRTHADVFEAKMYLEDKGVKNPTVIIHDDYIRRMQGGNKGVHKII